MANMNEEHFDLNSASDRTKYFNTHVKKEIEEIKEYLDNNTFVGFLLAKKSAGKGTYSKMFQEVIGQDRVVTISVGDLVREVHARISEDAEYKEGLMKKVSETYRGYISLEESLDAFISRDQSKLIPSEFILALVKEKIGEFPNKAVFIDGFPRGMDQITYALYFRQIMNLRPDPDFFVLINVPETIIESRIKSRVICPLCNTSRNIKLLPTEFTKYNNETKEVELLCDNSACEGYKKTSLVRKEGDEMGIEPIRDRLKNDGELIEKALQLHGIPKVVLNNAVNVTEKSQYQNYEITPEYYYEVDESTGNVVTKEKPWVINDDSGQEVISLVAAPVVLSMIKQIHKIVVPK